jgi:hypothetical protein
LPVSAIIVTHQIGRCHVPRERLHDLSRQSTLPSGAASPQTKAAVVGRDRLEKRK